MNMQEIASRFAACDCGHRHYDLAIEDIRIERGALNEAAAYAARKGLRRATLVCDERTYAAAGKALEERLQSEGVAFNTIKLIANANGDVLADELSVVQTFLETPQESEALFAVGAGTIHDVARFVSFKMNLPFVSVPTAASVDGFNSMGAPLIVRGFKTTYQLHSPIAVFADLDVLTAAPRAMSAAGFGDMIAKYTSLLDWEFSRIAAEEPYCPTVARLTREALDECVEQIDDIANGGEKGIATLTRGLMLSGLAMLAFGQSHPASGGEHHVSHVWEMEALKKGKKQALHGAKVGVSSRLVATRYLSEFAPLLENDEGTTLPEPIHRERDALAAAVRALPTAARYKEMLDRVGGPVEPAELDIDETSVAEALRTAHTIRNRYTILKFLNETQGNRPV